MIQLDTNIVIWLYNREPDRFTTKALKLLDEHSLEISPMVRLELQFLHEIGRLRNSAEEILGYLGERIELSLSLIAFNHIIDQTSDIAWTRDPFDRIIVAQSMAGNVPLLTEDARILENYPGAVWD